VRQESVIKSNLRRQFSRKVAEKLLAHRGRLRLGGQRSEVTILNADMRFFSQLAQDLEPDQVVEAQRLFGSSGPDYLCPQRNHRQIYGKHDSRGLR
jgi:class 3 adenylate cyclase